MLILIILDPTKPEQKKEEVKEPSPKKEEVKEPSPQKVEEPKKKSPSPKKEETKAPEFTEVFQETVSVWPFIRVLFPNSSFLILILIL